MRRWKSQIFSLANYKISQMIPFLAHTSLRILREQHKELVNQSQRGYSVQDKMMAQLWTVTLTHTHQEQQLWPNTLHLLKFCTAQLQERILHLTEFALQQSYNIYRCYTGRCMRAALKVTPPVLLCQPRTSEADGGCMTVEVEPSHQYSVTLCCHATDGSRGAVWQNSAWHGSCAWSKGASLNSSMWK